VIRRLRPFPANRHIAIGKETQQRFILTGFRRGGQRSRVGHNLVAARLRLLAQRFALPLARRRRFGKVFAPPPRVTSGRAFSSCSVMEPLPPFSSALLGHFSLVTVGP
jgi:hypothetical protein